MKYMLDTDICIFLLRCKSDEVINHFLMQDIEEICISSITYSELSYGAEKSQNSSMGKIALKMFLSKIQVLPYSSIASEEYGRIRSNLEKEGMVIGPLDMLIASHAKSEGLILVTNNVREFKRVKDLKIENWAE